MEKLKKLEIEDDAVSQSGWVFADLLVALSVIFLATISFVPSTNLEKIPSESPLGNVVRSQGFYKVYQQVSVEKFVNDLNDFMSRNAITLQVPILHVQIIISDEEATSKSGVLRAMDLSIKMRSEGINGNTDFTTYISTSDSLEFGDMIIRVVFGKSS